jgi:fatty-acyl-CoA synthase
MSVSRSELSPLSFLERSAKVWPERPAVAYGTNTLTFAELKTAASTVADALAEQGVGTGDRVAYLMPNVPEMLVAHFAVPLTGALLVALNTRLSSDEIAYILGHSGARVLVVDEAYLTTALTAVADVDSLERIVVCRDPNVPRNFDGDVASLGERFASYQDFITDSPANDWEWAVADEEQPIAINYTSGTTGRPKGVVYTHRGAYLNSFGELRHSYHADNTVYLWTLPMFHCNGWCTAWAVTAAAGLQVCLREVRGDVIWELIDHFDVTHLNGAPTVVTTIMNAPEARRLDHPLVITTAGAPPAPATILQMEHLGFRIVHVYGLTETYGPYAVCDPRPEWAALDPETRASHYARQGVGMLQADRLRVVDENMVDVASDGRTMGEIVMRGNNVMPGYYNDHEATEAAFEGGWFHSGDLGVVHSDGYVELRDRAKDIIISGGENISTVEVEQAIMSHQDVLEVAVIGVADDKWGERPRAYVVVRPGSAPSEDELLEHVKCRIARYKAPREIMLVDELPKTSTGKIQKFALRNQTAALVDS